MGPKTSVRARPDLAGSVMEFDTAADRANFIGLRAFPVFSVAAQSGNFGVVPIEELLRTRDTARAAGATYSRDSGRFTDKSFFTREHGAEELIDDRLANIYADYFDAEKIGAERALDVLLRNFEIRVAAKIFNAVTYTPTTITNEWDDIAIATPVTDIDAACKRMFAAIGLWPNALIINRVVFRNLRRCQQVIDQVKYVMKTTPQDIGAAELQAAFDLPHVLVAGGAKNTANEAADVAISSIWSNEYAAVARIATGADIAEPCIGRTFHYAGDGSKIGGTMESYRDDTRRSDVVRARMETDELIIYPECVELLDNITT